MRECSDKCAGIFTIAGNSHDLAYDRMESISKAPLRLLFESTYVKPIGRLTVVSPKNRVVNIVGFWYPERCLDRKETTALWEVGDIGAMHMVGHRFFGGIDALALSENFVEKSGFDAMILGHDHVQHPIETRGVTKVVRPGSLSRGTAHQSNLGRNVDVAVYSIDSDSWAYEPIKCKDPKYVFTSAVLHKDTTKKLTVQVLNQRIKDLIGSLEVHKGKSRIYEVLDRLEIQEVVKKVIEVYLVNEGIYRESKQEVV